MYACKKSAKQAQLVNAWRAAASVLYASVMLLSNQASSVVYIPKQLAGDSLFCRPDMVFFRLEVLLGRLTGEEGVLLAAVVSADDEVVL